MSVLVSTLAIGMANADPTLRSIEFEGNRYYSERRLVGFCELKTGQEFAPQLLESAQAKLLQSIAADGFYFCRLDSIEQFWMDDSSSVSLKFWIHEGGRLILKGLELTGDTLAGSAQALTGSRPGGPLYAEILEEDLWDLLLQREEAGHAFARLDIQNLDLTGDSLAIRAKIMPGPKVTLRGVQISGLEHTKPKVIAREARIRSGDIYQPSRVEKAQNRIRRLPFVEEVSDPALIVLGSDQYDLLFNVKETRANSFDGVIGYQPGAEGEEGQVTGLLDLTFQNLFGTGRKAKIHWERLNQYRQALELYYEEPWVAGLPFNLWAGFRQDIQDTLYLTRSVTGGASWAALDILTLSGSIFQDETLPDSAGRAYLSLYRSRARGGALQMDYETRDVPENPTRGLYYRSYVSAAQKNYEASAPDDNVDVRRYEADADRSYRLWGRQILNLQLHGRHLQSDELPIPQPDLYRLGGSRTLRGYREDQFLGHTVAWGTVEYRLWMDKLSRIYAFFNLGYYERETETAPDSGQFEKISDWPWGYGVGFRQGTRLGIIGFDFALGEGDALATAKVHFRLINRF
jgi:outer membrane protein assembly factor BamA